MPVPLATWSMDPVEGLGSSGKFSLARYVEYGGWWALSSSESVHQRPIQVNTQHLPFGENQANSYVYQ
jgi:hypothetical protein